MNYKNGYLGIVLSCAAGIVTAAPGIPATEKTSAREVLPDTVIPVHYELALSPDADALTFSATVAITIQVRIKTATIALNAIGLSFDHVEVDGSREGSVRNDEGLGRAVISVRAPLAPGLHILSIDYHGKIDRTTFGFFAMDYTGPDRPRRTRATNFEPAGARQLLPCWDEPGRKATFTASVVAPKNRMAHPRLSQTLREITRT